MLETIILIYVAHGELLSDIHDNFLTDRALSIQEAFRSFGASLIDEPLYEKIVDGIINDHELLKLGEYVRQEQPIPNVVLAAVHYLLLEGNDDPLHTYYPNLIPNPSSSRNVFPVFRTFCFKHWDKLVDVIREGRTQTNEIGRCRLFVPVFQYLHFISKEPLILIELGSSAGLNLNFDHYNYNYLLAGSEMKIRGRGKWVELVCEFKGSKFPDLKPRLPPVKKKIGIDLHPLDVTKQHDTTWLKALLWPSQIIRFERIDQAIQIAKKYPPQVINKDGFNDIADILKSMGAGQICLFHSFVINQISEEERAIFYQTLSDLSIGLNRSIAVISIEWLSDEGTLIVMDMYYQGTVESVTLAKCHYHGEWIEWLI